MKDETLQQIVSRINYLGLINTLFTPHILEANIPIFS